MKIAIIYRDVWDDEEVLAERVFRDL